MPWTSTIKPDGSGDFTTLAAWEAWANTDPVGLLAADGGMSYYAQCYSAGGDVGKVTFSNVAWNSTTPTAHPMIFAAEEHNGDVTAGAYIDGTAGIASEIHNSQLAYLDIIGMRFNVPDGVALNRYAINNNAPLFDGVWLVDRCLFHVTGTGSRGTECIGHFNSAVGHIVRTMTVRNCLVIGKQKGLFNTQATTFFGSTPVCNCFLYNNTVYQDPTTPTGIGIQTSENIGPAPAISTINLTMRNNIILDCTTADYREDPITPIVNGVVDADYNMDSDGSLALSGWGGPNDLPNSAVADVLADVFGGDYSLKVGSTALNAGETVAEVTVDIAQIGRPQGAAYDMGAFETVVAAPEPEPEPEPEEEPIGHYTVPIQVVATRTL